MASTLAAYSFWHMSATVSSREISPESGLPPLLRPAMALAIASLKAMNPLNPSLLAKRETVASATPQASASSEMDIYWLSFWWMIT